MNITKGKTLKETGAFVTIQLWTIKWKLVCYPRYQFLTWEGGDKRKRKWRGGEVAIIRGRGLFQIFRSKGGDYSREAINRGTPIIRGNTVLNFISNPVGSTLDTGFFFRSEVAIVSGEAAIQILAREIRTSMHYFPLVQSDFINHSLWISHLAWGGPVYSRLFFLTYNFGFEK